MKKYKTITKGRYKGLKYKKQGKFISEIKNPEGKLKPLAISQRGMYAGFTAHYKTKPYRKVARGKDAEKLGVRLAKKGHKSIVFLD